MTFIDISLIYIIFYNQRIIYQNKKIKIPMKPILTNKIEITQSFKVSILSIGDLSFSDFFSQFYSVQKISLSAVQARKFRLRFLNFIFLFLLKTKNLFSRFLAASTFYNKLTTDYENCLRSIVVEEQSHKECRVSQKIGLRSSRSQSPDKFLLRLQYHLAKV